jgi:signal recognition particle receptor subunit beta
MATFNYGTKEIFCKIVYYGPGMCGKTTNLQYIYSHLPSDNRGNLTSLATEAERTLYFDFLPLQAEVIPGFTTRLQLYTVPGQVFYNATRKLVLRGVDGLVFVADSQYSKAHENVESFRNMLQNLKEYGYSLKDVPVVIQYNKRDLSEAMPIHYLEYAVNMLDTKLHTFEAVAVDGMGVFDTLNAVSKLVLSRIRTA